MSTIEKAAARLVAKAKPLVPPKYASLGEVPAESTGPAEIEAELPDNDSSVDVTVNKSAEITKTPTAFAQHHTCELDFQWLAENGFLVPGHDNPQQAQEFRRIKRPLLLNMQPQIAAEHPLPSNVIFITSALPGEGKTFVALNLALSLAAELDKKVLLIDGDAAKGDLSRWMGIHGENGLVDLLTTGVGYGETSIIDTNVDRLQVMPCGKVADNLDELYASSLMKVLMAGLAEYDKNRVLVVDGPPLIATTEASVLARGMGQVVMVVEANKTPQAAVEQAAAQLEGCQSVSMLLNKASASSSSGYGYGYGYGHHASRGAVESNSAAQDGN
jgi:protein-tyrosine kinase